MNPGLAFLASVQAPLSFNVFLTNIMGLVPWQFHESDAAVLKAHVGDFFQFPPSTRTANLLEPGESVNGPADGYGLDILDLSDDFEIHSREIVAKLATL